MLLLQCCVQKYNSLYIDCTKWLKYVHESAQVCTCDRKCVHLTACGCYKVQSWKYKVQRALFKNHYCFAPAARVFSQAKILYGRTSSSAGRCAGAALASFPEPPSPPEPGRCAPVFLPSRDVVPESGFFLPETARSSQAGTLRQMSGASSLLGRTAALRKPKRARVCTTSRLGRESPFRAEKVPDVPAGKRCGPSRRLSRAGILRTCFSPEPGRCARVGPFSFLKPPNPPKPGRCAR